MIGLIIALCIVCVLLANTWCMIFTLASKGGTWIGRRDLKFLILCSFINCYIILGVDTLFKNINERFYKWNRKRKWRKQAKEYKNK